MMRAAVLVPTLLAALAAGPSHEALQEGNRLFRGQDYEGAMASWAAGYERQADPLLAYNLGTAAHQLGRQPEAVLWYRRAAAGLEGDRWLRDNLELARRELREKGVSAIEPTGAWALWIRSAAPLQLAGAVLAWAALGCLRVRPRAARRAALAVLAALSCATFAAGALIPAQPAVVLEDCPEGPPAGSEVWVVPRRAGDWRVLGPSPLLRCPASSVAPIW